MPSHQSHPDRGPRPRAARRCHHRRAVSDSDRAPPGAVTALCCCRHRPLAARHRRRADADIAQCGHRTAPIPGARRAAPGPALTQTPAPIPDARRPGSMTAPLPPRHRFRPRAEADTAQCGHRNRAAAGPGRAPPGPAPMPRLRNCRLRHRTAARRTPANQRFLLAKAPHSKNNRNGSIPYNGVQRCVR